MTSIIDRWELIKALQDLAEELGERPTRKDMNERGRYSSQPYYSEFGSWNAALKAAGFEESENKQIPEDELIADIKRVAGMVDRDPTLEDIADHGKFDKTTYIRHFGSWLDARDAAGLSGTEIAYGRQADTERLLTDLQTFGFSVGRPPTQKEIDAFATYSAQTYYRKFDGLFDAFDAAGVPYHEHTRPTVGRDYYGSRWRKVAERVRQRDGGMCVVCGMSGREHINEYEERLHVHHIDKPREEIQPEGIDEAELVTLCTGCHLKWERSPNDPREW